MLGDAIVEQHVGRAARCARDRLGDRRIVGWHDVRPARADHVRGQKRLDEISQPVAVDADVGVGIRDDLPGGFGQADVARGAQSAVRDIDDTYARMAVSDRGRAIARSVVDEDDFVIRVGQLVERREAVLDRIVRVVRADDDRHPWPRRAYLVRKRRVREGGTDGVCRRFWVPSAIDQPKCPVFDGQAAAPPLVGPGERNRTTRAFLERRAQVQRRNRRLA